MAFELPCQTAGLKSCIDYHIRVTMHCLGRKSEVRIEIPLGCKDTL